jgi:hypothetical protein
VELVCSRYDFDDLVELRSHYFGFTGVPKPLVLSRPAVFRTVYFGAINSTVVEGGLRLLVTGSGVVNGLRLTSPLKIFDGISFKSSDSLMPPVIVPLPRDLEVSAGNVVELQFRYRCETDWRDFECDARCDRAKSSNDRLPATLGSIAIPRRPRAPFASESSLNAIVSGL